MKGKVLNFNPRKGYGFLRTEDGGDLFFHFSALQMEGYKTIEPGVAVEYAVEEGKQGPQASFVREI